MSISNDEWMYELQQQEKNDKWKKYNEATKLYFEKYYPQATLLINEFLEKNHNDLPARNFQKRCLERSSEEGEIDILN